MASVRKASWTYKGVTKFAWQVAYTDPDTKKRHTKSFKAKKAADSYRLKVETEIEAGTHTAAARSKTIAEACEAYLRHAEEKKNDGRIGWQRLGQIKLTLDRDVVPFLGGRLISELTVDAVEELYSTLLKERQISPHILRARFIILKQVEEFAFRREWTKKGTVAIALRSLRGMTKPEQKRFTPEQVLTLLACARVRRGRTTPRACHLLQCMVNLAAFCGLRFGEIVGLTVEHVDFGEGVIRVRHSMTMRDELKGPKTRAGNRDVPMPEHVAALLREWLATYHKPEERGLVFTARNASFLRSGTFHRLKWRPLLQAAGLGCDIGERDAHHFHALRGFAASWWIDNGVPVTTVAKWLGHSKPDMTLEFYARSMVSAVGQREVADRMATRLLARLTPLVEAKNMREHA